MVEVRGLETTRNLIPLGMTKPAFLERCKNIFAVIDDLQTAPLRKMAVGLGLDKEFLKDFKSLKLLSCISQLARIAVDSGFNLVEDSATIVADWTTATPIPKELDSIFALQVLRVSGAHNLSKDKREEYLAALKTFGITEKQCAGGWGLALDIVYDRLIVDLKTLNELLTNAWLTA
jgi:hypothetical protein